MRIYHLALSVLLAIMMLGCARQPKVETVTEAKPYSVRVAQERSIYQAQKIQERLAGMDVAAYIVETQDSVEQRWYNVLSGAFSDSAASSAHVRYLDSMLHLPNLQILDTRAMADSVAVMAPGKSVEKKTAERRRIEANAPSVPSSVMDAVQKFPDNNTFFLRSIIIASFESDKGLEKARQFETDLPRGITMGNMAAASLSFVEVQYQDNLYDDQVTLSVSRLKADARAYDKMVFEKYNQDTPADHVASYAVALEFSQKILHSGRYENESIKALEWKAYKQLLGYKVGLTTGRGVYRSYFVLVDSDCEYLLIAQSEEKSEQEMEAILAEVGRGDGLKEYDEFYNSFYLLPDRLDDGDIFLGYTIEKLGRSYARRRGYSAWSMALVGHWNVNGFFWNRSKGLWTAGILDLLTTESQEHIYGTLYTDAVETDENIRAVYGVPGHILEEELNFGYSRYVSGIGADNFEEIDYIDRAERIQLSRGGYKK